MDKSSNNSNTLDDIPKQKKYSREALLFHRLKRKLLKHVYLLRAAIAILLIGIVIVVFSLLANLAHESGLTQKVTLARDFLIPKSELLNSSNGKTNILILGKGGAGHDAPDLTDTLILATVDRTVPKTTLISIPRDIWVDPLKTKINSVYYFGNQKEAGGGLVLAKSTVEEIVGLPIHYALVFDFSSFKEVVEVLGGIEVEVQTAFVDEKFPIAGKEDDLCDGDPEFACRFETIEFKAGLQAMDAETALKFVRSRNADGDEGTDLARGARQQKVIDAVISKILSKEILLSPKRMTQVIDITLASFETDMQQNQLATIARYIYNAKNNMVNQAIPEDLLENPRDKINYDNLYVFVPTSGDWKEVQEWVKATTQ